MHRLINLDRMRLITRYSRSTNQLPDAGNSNNRRKSLFYFSGCITIPSNLKMNKIDTCKVYGTIPI